MSLRIFGLIGFSSLALGWMAVETPTAPTAASNLAQSPSQASSSPIPSVSSIQTADQAEAQMAEPARLANQLKPEPPVATPSKTDQAQANPSQTASPWRFSDSSMPVPALPLPPAVRQYQAVQIDMDSLSAPAIGDRLQLALLNGQQVEVQVEHTELNPNGDLSWRGRLQEQGQDYPVVMTYGENAVFATITTSKGSYSLESIQGSGWLYKNPAEFELSDTHATDHLIPPDSEPDHHH